MGKTNILPEANENSPLMSQGQTSGPNHASAEDLVDNVDESSKSSWYLFLLTVSIGAFLIIIGMSKALLAFVWIAGPLTGALVQPYIGIRSDNCRSRWGKRKPFMVGGGAATLVSLLALAWVKEIVGGFLSIFGVDPASTGTKITTITLATIFMYCLDFAINTVQAGIRAFILDNCPAHQQELSNAWASRWTGVGNIVGYIFGYMNLPKHLPFLGKTQFQILSALASISLTATLIISCLYIKERDPRLDGPPPSDGLSVIQFFRQTFKSIRNLPTQIARVCEVQLAAWTGWFPFLYYSSTYVGQLYVNPIFAKHPDLPRDQIDKTWEEATRVGTFALLIYAIVSFAANMILPLFVVPTYETVLPNIADQEDNFEDLVADEEENEHNARSSFSGARTGTGSAPLLGRTNAKATVESDKKPSWLTKLQVPGLTLRRTWISSHILFAFCAFCTIFVSSYQAGSAIIGLTGICWAVTLWAPFAFISAEVSRMDLERRLRRRHAATGSTPRTRTHAGSNSYVPLPVEEDREGDEDRARENDPENGRSKLSSDEDENLVQAGIILGLHNVAVSFPQIFSSLICSGIFKVLQKPRGAPYDDSVGWVLRFGGCAALVAAWLTKRLHDGPH
ncbi:hypothetical protein N7470_003131 [Penicillium chermesinum]|nr:hypothetical protein N7470_003131 [Penicillium chermesinum]